MISNRTSLKKEEEKEKKKKKSQEKKDKKIAIHKKRKEKEGASATEEVFKLPPCQWVVSPHSFWWSSLTKHYCNPSPRNIVAETELHSKEYTIAQFWNIRRLV